MDPAARLHRSRSGSADRRPAQTPHQRKAVTLPTWVNPWTAAPLGILMTGADLPNAVPYFIAIERLVNANVETPQALLVLACYALVYCLPCLILLIVGTIQGARVRKRLAAALPSPWRGENTRSKPVDRRWSHRSLGGSVHSRSGGLSPRPVTSARSSHLSPEVVTQAENRPANTAGSISTTAAEHRG